MHMNMFSQGEWAEENIDNILAQFFKSYQTYENTTIVFSKTWKPMEEESSPKNLVIIYRYNIS